jgi:hypothetical protein
VRRRDEMTGSKEDNPITASRNDHAQSKCQRAWPAKSVNTHHSIVFIVLLFQENKSFRDSTICIHPLMYVKPCREQYYQREKNLTFATREDKKRSNTAGPSSRREREFKANNRNSRGFDEKEHLW